MKIHSAAGLLLLPLALACGDDQSQKSGDDALELRANELPEDLREPTRVMEAPPPPERKTMTELPKLLLDQGVTLDLMNTHLAVEQAPEKYYVKLVTSKGDIVIEVVRDWAPLGADRFYNLVKIDYYRNIYFHRVIKDFVAQFGIHGNTMVSTAWTEARIRDDVPKQSNRRGYVSFSRDKIWAHSRTTEVFINLKDNARLDQRNFAPFGRVTSGMKVADSMFSGYGPTFQASLIREEGREGVRARFPEADVLHYAEFVERDE